jgi:alpha-tubulin suppressor-like RCC1 family protein
MSGFNSPIGDFDRIFVTDQELIDRYAYNANVFGVGQQAQVTEIATTKSSYVQLTSFGGGWKKMGKGYNVNSITQCGIKNDNTLWGWGNNTTGMGTGSFAALNSPMQIFTTASTSAWQSCASGFNNIAAVGIDGSLWTCGQNSWGQLGDGSTTDSLYTAVRIGSSNDWKQVSHGGIYYSGTTHSNFNAIKNDGTLWGWGDGSYGLNGDGTFTSRSVPTQESTSGTNWKQVQTGTGMTVAIKKDGTCWHWGAILNGAPPAPEQEATLSTDWKYISAGAIICGIKNNGSLWTWGNSNTNLLGRTGTTSVPGQITNAGKDWKYCDGGLESAACAVKMDGSIWAWGNSGYLHGNGTTANSGVPVQATTLNKNVRSAVILGNAIYVLTD